MVERRLILMVSCYTTVEILVSSSPQERAVSSLRGCPIEKAGTFCDIIYIDKG